MPRSEREALVRAIDLQQRSHALLRWVGDMLRKGVVPFASAHHFATFDEAALDWIETHWENLPPDARPPREDLVGFVALFAGFLDASYDLVEDPGKRLYSPDAHCFCPMCSWLVDVPHLRPKKLKTAHKQEATRLERKVLRELAAAEELALSDPDEAALLADPDVREARALCAWAAAVLRGLDGLSVGPARLALWRRFAWTPQGSPRKGFVITADAVVEAQAVLLERIRG